MNKRFVIGIDRSKMKLSDVNLQEQKDIVDSGQDIDEDGSTIFDKGQNSKYDKFTNFKV